MVFANIYDELKKKEFWESFSKDFHIENQELFDKHSTINFDQDRAETADEWIKTEGYYQIKQCLNADAQKNKAALVKKLVASNILPVFAFIYDEFWLAQIELKPMIEKILGEGYSLRPCFWVWHLDPNQEESGWGIHRDGNSETINEDGSTKALSLWIPLSDATPLNGCMYLVPMNRDKTPRNGSAKRYDFEISEVRAIPGEVGDAFIWNHWVVHWGGHSSKKAPEARMSMAFELEEAGSNLLNAPLLDPFKMPSFEDRLRMIAYQIHQYTHMYKFSAEMLKFSKDILGQEKKLILNP